MSDALGAVVIGTGFGCVTHVRALRAAGFEVRAVVGRDPVRTAERAALFGVPLGLTSVEEALGLAGVDAVTIATPPHTHAELALASIGTGRHVLCEKPLASDAPEAVEMLAAAEAAGVVHLLGTEFRWDPGQATLARAVAGGAIGEPRLATFILHVPVLADPAGEVPDWWADAGQGGGWLGAHASQVIDQIRSTLGEFVGVSATLPHVSGRAMTAEDGFVVHFRLASGLTGVLQSTSGEWGPPLVVTRIVGSRGTAWIDGLGASVWVADAAGSRQVAVGDDLPTGAPEPLPRGTKRTAYERMLAHGLDLGPYTCLAAAFRDRILGHPTPSGSPRPAIPLPSGSPRPAIPLPSGSPRPADFADGVAAMEVLDAIRRAAAEETWVALPPA